MLHHKSCRSKIIWRIKLKSLFFISFRIFFLSCKALQAWAVISSFSITLYWKLTILKLKKYDGLWKYRIYSYFDGHCLLKTSKLIFSILFNLKKIEAFFIGLEFVYSKYGIINQNSVYCLIVFNFYNYYYYYFCVHINILCNDNVIWKEVFFFQS